MERAREFFAQLQARGLLTDRVSSDQLHRGWTIVVAGIVSQQLSNAPEEAFDQGTYMSAIPEVIRMFIGHYKSQRNTQ